MGALAALVSRIRSRYPLWRAKIDSRSSCCRMACGRSSRFPSPGDIVGLRSVLLRNRRSFFLRIDLCGRQSEGGGARHEVRHGVPPARRSASMGRVS
jgi:hypothetical protein